MSLLHKSILITQQIKRRSITRQTILTFSHSIRSYSNKPKLTPSYYHNFGTEPLVYRTLGQNFDLAAEKFGDREAIVSCQDQKRYTFTEMQEKTSQLASGLLELGFEKGDRIGIWSPNTINWCVAMIGIAKAGLVSVALNPAYQAAEIAYSIEKVKMKGIIASDTFKTTNYYNILDSIFPTLKDPASKDHPIVIIDSSKSYEGARKFDDVLAIGSSSTSTIDIHGPEPDDDCNIQFTSGTTGQPKAAVLSHHNIVNNGRYSGIRNEMNVKYHRLCVQNPFFHVYGIIQGLSGGLAFGNTLVLPNPGYNPVDSLKAIVNEKCSFIFGTPTMYVDLIARQKEMKFPINTAEIALIGGSPCPPQLYKDVKSTFNLKTVKNLYGLTETTCSAFQSLPAENDSHIWESVGYLQDHTEAKVVDKNGLMVPMGTPGELYIRGYNTMLRYFGDEKKTKETISYDKWLKTGDQFILHEDGYGRIVGRFKEMVIRGGENIFPKEIESLLATHPDIIEAQVLGVPDNRMGEELCAFIRTVNGKNITQKDVGTFFKGKIAHFKIPHYVRVVDAFPTTTSGKIQKFKLKELFLNEKMQ